jgi:hypothetical protein
MAIGDDLFTMLGLIPARDRAGIARGTMADEAKASMAANGSGNAEGHALMATAPRPPDITLPDGVGAEYASGKQRAAPYGGPAPLPQSLPPAPQERTIAAGPAAAPPPEVKRNSDIILEAMQKQAQQARMMQIINGIGQMVSGATGHGGGGGGGGGGAAAGGGVGDLATLLKMRDDETTKIQMVDQAQRMFGLSKQDAEGRYASGDLAKLFDPKTIAQREADQRAGKSRMELMKPEVVDEIAKRTGMPREVVETSIRNGDIDAKKVSDILNTQATTAHTQATTGKVNIENMTALQKKAFVSDVMSSPEQYAKLWGVTPDEVRTAAQGGPEAVQKLVEGLAPKKTDKQQDLAVENRMRREKGLPELTPSEYSKQSQQPHVLPDEVGRKAGTESADKAMNTSAETARTAHQNILDRHMTQDLWREDMLAGGLGAEKQTDWRNTFARLFNLTDEQASDTKLYFSAINKNIQASAKSLPGQLSDKDVRFLKDMEGGQELTPQAIRRLEIIHEKIERMRIAKHNAYYDEQTGRPALSHLKDYYGKYDPPEPGRFIKENLRANPEDIAALLKDPKGAKRAFEKEYGMGVADYVIKNEGRIE